MTDDRIIYANHNGSIYKTSLELGQVRYISDMKNMISICNELKEDILKK